jgi:surface polysaccharide O-acyltransferase-like enzyme
LFIVAWHSYGPWEIDSFGEKLVANLITGGTVLFLFISGFFFHYVIYENYYNNRFVAKKARNVMVPYLILSLAGIALYLLAARPLPFADTLLPGGVSSAFDYLELLSVYLWTGRVATAYWYIPFIFVVFLLSPVFVRYIQLSVQSRLAILLGLLAVSVLVQRPVANLSLVHSFVYYVPVYLLGINCAIHRDEVIEFVSGRALLLGALVLLLAAIQAALVDGFGYHHKASMFTYEGVDILLLQKIVMCFFLLSVFHANDHREIPGLKLLASASFAIYFLHPWLLKFITTDRFYRLVDFLPDIGVFLVTVPVVVLGSLCIAFSARLVLRRYSRFVLGW